eukprot:UN04728
MKDACGDRAQMPCGHIIGSGSMTGYVRSKLDENKWEIKCPAVVQDTPMKLCGATWDWKYIRSVGVFTTDELNNFERKLGNNYVREVLEAFQCPHCKSWLCRSNKVTTNCVKCPICRGKDFCFICHEIWDTDTAGNCKGCRKVIDKANETLRNCDKINR